MMPGASTEERGRTAASASAELAAFIAKYSPAIAREGRAALAKLRRLIPGASELVYDNFNWLVVGFGPSERASEAVISLVFTPRWLTLCFLQNGPELPDPQKLLRGSGRVVRSTRLGGAADLDRPAIRALIRAALKRADVPIRRGGARRLIIKSVSARQRSRRPRGTTPARRLL